MKQPLQIVFRNMSPSDAIEADIREKAGRLEHFCSDIVHCRVAVEARHRHHHQGNLYHVRVDVTVPGGEIVASREPSQDHAHEDVYVAIRDAFDAVRRRLEDYVRRRRGQVKHHELPPHGRIAELYPEQGYGMIATPDGRLVYFHKNSLVDAKFEQLKIGDEVRFAEEMGERGPQASTVHRVGKHHIVG